VNPELLILLLFQHLSWFVIRLIHLLPKINNEKEEEDKTYLKHIIDIPPDKNTSNNALKESYIQNNNTNTLNNIYTSGYYVSGYPKQIITD